MLALRFPWTSISWLCSVCLFGLLPTAAAQDLPRPLFSHAHGFYDAPFSLHITSEASVGQVYFTTDGSAPTINNATPYAGPIPITTTTVVRAALLQNGASASPISTATFLFLADVINQPNDPPGYPATWGPYFEFPGTAIADYEMDPEVTTYPRYARDMEEALLALPTLSIVTDKNHLFSHSTHPDSGGIYIYTGPPENGDVPGLGDGWERPASVEFFSREDPEGFQADAGLRLHGGHSRRVEKTPKHSFRIAFRTEYGVSRLRYPLFGEDAATSINSVVLRAGYGNSWLHSSHSERRRNQLIRDLWAKDTQRAMGHPAGRGIYVHLYLNGLYWGIYNPTERPDRIFAAANMGGEEDDYDVIKDRIEVVDGTAEAWDTMMDVARGGRMDEARYQRLQGNHPDGARNPQYEPYLDVVNFIDYMVLNLYGANWDWDEHNWLAIRNRVHPGKGFQFFSWDAEHILEGINANELSTNYSNRPSGLFHLLNRNASFRLLFADRVQRHRAPGGALSTEAGQARWMTRADVLEPAIIAEAARWGDYRRDVHPWRQNGPFELYGKEHWLEELDFIMQDHLPQRMDVFVAQLRQAGLFPDAKAPAILLNDQPAPVTPHVAEAGDVVSMAADGGTVYFTLDGTDPTSAEALVYTDPFPLTHGVTVKARVFENNEWSALSEAAFVVPAALTPLRITEIHYNPLPTEMTEGRYFEFIELHNPSSAPLDVSGVAFTDGIRYQISAGTMLDARGFLVLASDHDHFEARYGFAPFGVYDGALDNAGEHLLLVDATGAALQSVQYDDRAPWPEASDGEGYSLVLIDPTTIDLNDPTQWQASSTLHGTPGIPGAQSTHAERPALPPSGFALAPNYPNPFSSTTHIDFTLPHASTVSLTVVDVMGRAVAELVQGTVPAGTHTVTWDASRLASGIYFYRLNTGVFTQTRRLTLMK